MQKFKDSIKLIGINPFTFIPEKILAVVLKEAGKEKGLIPNKAVINKIPCRQTKIINSFLLPVSKRSSVTQQLKSSSKC